MKSNEFRINNLLLKDNNIEKVAVINCDNTIRIFPKTEKENGLTYGCYPLSFFNPIPLTEELLFKFGFRTEEPYCFELDDIVINTKRELMWVYSKKSNKEFEFKTPIYAHELQNLYFALTNNELEII